MKCTIALVLAIFAIFCVYTISAKNYNVTFGVIGPRDVLLDREIVRKKYKPLLVVTEEYTYPRSGFISDYNITGIRCTDTYTDGNGGNTTLTKGGPGAYNVTLRLKSQRNHGFNFIIEVYGR